MSERDVLVAVDIGGTFTDLVALDHRAGTVLESKAPTTPSDFAVGVADVLGISNVDAASIGRLIHGTTVVINAITERTGVKTALITTKGFRDTLAIGRGNRPDMYNLKFRKPEPFVPRSLRFEVSERVRPDGTVVQPLDPSELDVVAAKLCELRVGAVAICFLHSYAHPEHEQQAATRLKALAPDLAVTISSDITREWREYERSSTAVLNAYVQPRTRSYLAHLERRLDGMAIAGSRYVMTSNGGTATFSHAMEQPIQLVESGPVGGVIGAHSLGSRIGESNLITLDIGGTTAKCSIIVDGQLSIAGDYRLEWTPLSPGYPLKIPIIDIVEIGAGGGSVIWFDRGGALRIGPKSAGAEPGPACYGLGGTEPTITDVMVLAGYIPPGPIPGSGLSIDTDHARQALAPVASRLGVSIEQAVLGVLDLFIALTVDAMRLVSVRRGHDPRDYTLVAFGGGGPLHAAVLGNELGVKQVIVPRMPATFSAWGMLHADPRVDLTQTRVSLLSQTTQAAREQTFTALEGDSVAALLDQGFGASSIQKPSRSLDMRYQGQEHTVQVVVGPDNGDDRTLVKNFNSEHKRLYTFALEDTPVELVNFRVTATAKLRSEDVVHREQPLGVSDPEIRSSEVLMGDPVERLPVKVYQRSDLPAGFRVIGPAMIRETATTTVVPRGFDVLVDTLGNLVLTN